MRSLLFVSAALLSSVLFSCGATAGGTCSAVNCAGCCTSDGQCVDGTTDLSCGSGALLCNTCSGGQVCVAHRCEFRTEVDAGTDAGNNTPVDAGTPIIATAEVWTWADFPTSACGNGAPTGVGVNITNRSKDLLIYLQGGGACWNALTCGAGAAANIGTGYTSANFASEGTIGAAPFVRTNTTNPFKDMSFVFVPYCTGDVHAGDAVKDYPPLASFPARTVHHKGGKNMEAFLLRLKDTFPEPTRVFVSGSSAGAYGAQLNFERVAATWPNAELHLLADCGQMVAPGGTTLSDWLGSWNFALPPDCPTCATDFTQYPKYLHGKHPMSRFGLLAYTQDGTLRQFFGLDAATFQTRTLDLATSAYDSTTNAKYFIVAGTSHVMLDDLNTLQGPGGVTLLDWTTRLVTGSPTWQSVKP